MTLVHHRLDRAPAILMLAISIGCHSTRSTDLSFTVAVIRGSVSSSAGFPLVGVDVTVNSYFLPCASGATPVANATGRTTTDGSYRVEIVTPTVPTTQCVSATATVGDRSATVAGGQVQFKREGDIPYDSVQVDVIIP
jgi:hypothetical protein